MNKCEKCGLRVYWELDVKAGHMQCHNFDNGKIHWDKCSERKTKIALKTGVPFKDKNGDHGFVVDDKKRGGKKKMYMMQKSLMITGKHYKPSDETGVPWRTE